jgi:hypothetical protein
MNKVNVEALSWEQARVHVAKSNPGLAKAIDELSPPNSLKMIKARYSWAQSILKHGELQLPTEGGGTVSIRSPDVDSKLKKALLYNYTMPAGIVLNNSIELFVEFDNQVIPFSLMKEGKIFALWSALDVQDSAHLGRVWNINAGARSLYLTAKMTDAGSFKRLKKEFKLRSMPPKSFSEQYNVFKEISQREEFGSDWHVDLLFFTNDWLENLSTPSWRLFREYLLNCFYHETAYLRNQVVFDYMFSCALKKRNLRPDPYISDTARHLYGIAQGVNPGFKFVSCESAGPINRLEQIVDEVYGLKYAPNFIYADSYNIQSEKERIYYSLNNPTLMNFSPRSKMSSSNLDSLRSLLYTIEKLNEVFDTDELGLSHTLMHQNISKSNFSGFHSESDATSSIIETTVLASLDENAKKKVETFGKPFCDFSTFLRGLICVSPDG